MTYVVFFARETSENFISANAHNIKSDGSERTMEPNRLLKEQRHKV